MMSLESQKVTSIMSLGGDSGGRGGRREQVREGGLSSGREFVLHSEYNRESLEDRAEDRAEDWHGRVGRAHAGFRIERAV